MELPEIADRFVSACFHNSMPRKEWQRVLRNSDRSYPGAATAVRDAERFVQVQVANISTDRPGGRPTCAFIFAPSI